MRHSLFIYLQGLSFRSSLWVVWNICPMPYAIIYSFPEGRGSEYVIKNNIWNRNSLHSYGGSDHVCGGVLLGGRGYG